MYELIAKYIRLFTAQKLSPPLRFERARALSRMFETRRLEIWFFLPQHVIVEKSVDKDNTILLCVTHVYLRIER